jgi:MFS family permease
MKAIKGLFAGSVPAPGPMRTMGLAILVNTTGGGLFVAISAIYFTRVVGLGVFEVASGLGIAALVSVFSGIPIGKVADRMGPREVQVALLVVIGLLSAGYLLISAYWQFVVLTTVIRVLDRGVAAVAGALVAGTTAGPDRVRTRAFGRSMMNLGLSVGAGLAIIALQADDPAAYRALVLVDAATYVVSALLYMRLPHVPPIPKEPGASSWPVLKDGPYMAMTLLFSVINIQNAMLTFALPLWVVTYTSAPAGLVSVLLMINTVGCVLLQMTVSRRVEDPAAAVRASRIGGLILLASCAIFAGAYHTGRVAAIAIMVVGILVMLAAELLTTSAQFCLAFQLAPENAQGQYQGMFSTGAAASAVVGPSAMALLPLGLHVTGWIVLGVIFAVAGLLMAPVVQIAQRRTIPAAVTQTAVS